MSWYPWLHSLWLLNLSRQHRIGLVGLVTSVHVVKLIVELCIRGLSDSKLRSCERNAWEGTQALEPSP